MCLRWAALEQSRLGAQRLPCKHVEAGLDSGRCARGSDDDIEDIQREVAVLADCRCDAITQYYASLVEPATSQLLIVMELMAATAADLVRPNPATARQQSGAALGADTLGGMRGETTTTMLGMHPLTMRRHCRSLCSPCLA